MRVWPKVLDVEKRSNSHADMPVDPHAWEAFRTVQSSDKGVVGGIRDGEAVVRSC